MRTNDYSNQVINGIMHIWLQDCGFCPAKLATEFKAGDKIAYNFGHTYEIVKIEEKSKCFLTFTVKNKDGNIYKQNVRKDVYKPYAN